MPKCLYAFERRLFGERFAEMSAAFNRSDLSTEERHRLVGRAARNFRPDQELQLRTGDGQPRWATWKLLTKRSEALFAECGRLRQLLAEQTGVGK